MDFNHLDKAEEIIHQGLTGIITEDDFSEIRAKKQEGARFTQTTFRTFRGEKISRIALERYTINGRANGLVLNIYPDPAYDIPIFTFQLGGQIPDKVIFVLDIIPLAGTQPVRKLPDIYQRHNAAMNLQESALEWIREICTGNALICQYKPLEPEKIFSALSDYLSFWVSECYTPTVAVTDETGLKQITSQILRFKKKLHANDAGLEIYLKKFGKAMAAAIEDAAFGAEPALNKESNPPDPDVASPSDTNPDDGSGITWTNEAEQYLLDAPGFVRKKIRTNAEEKANKLGVRVIDRQFVENLRKNEH